MARHVDEDVPSQAGNVLLMTSFRYSTEYAFVPATAVNNTMEPGPA